MAANEIKIVVGGQVDQSLTQSAKAGSDALRKLGDSASMAYDEIAAGQAAMDRISASIDEMVASALRANQTFEGIGSSAVQAITPIATLENRLEELRNSISKSATVQSAANFGVQFDLVNRNLEETREKINAATAAAIGLSNAFNTAARSAVSVGTALNRLGPAIKPSLDGLKLTAAAANQTSVAMNRAKSATGSASMALIDVSRVIQDAPFGIIGVGNNITQLADSFARLKMQSGSTGSALKALGGSLLGPGGLGFAVSLITTALTFATVGFGAWTRGLSGGKDKADEAAEATKKFLDTLKSVDEVVRGAAGSMQGQISQVRSLASIIRDTNESYEVRKRALQELQQVNKEYFGTLKLEDAATGALTAKVNEYTKALVAQAVVKGFTDEISRLSTELVQQEAATEKARTKLNQLKAEVARTPRLQSNAQGVVTQSKAYSELVSKVQEATIAFNTQRDAEERIATSRAEFEGRLRKANEEMLRFADLTKSSSDSNKKEEDALKKRIAALKELQDLTGLDTGQQIELASLEIKLAERDSLKAGFTANELQQQIDGIIEKAFPTKTFEFKLKNVKVTPGKLSIDPEIDVAAATLPGGIIPENYTEKFISGLNKGLNKSIKDGIDISSMLGQTLADSVTSIAEGGGVFESIFKAIASSLQEFGKALIAYGIATKALKIAIKNPYAAIAAGAGLIIAGAALKNNLPKFADGVTDFAGGFALVGERGPEVVRLPGGSDVIPNNALNSTAIALMPSIRFRGADFQIMLERVSNQRSQLG